MRFNKKYFAGFVLFVSVLTSLQVFGINLLQFRPVFVFEAEASNKIMIDYICDGLLKEWYIAKDTQSRYQQRNEVTPEWLVQKIVYLESKLKNLSCR